MKFKQKAISANYGRRHQVGLTLLELVISIAIMTLVSVGMVQLSDRYANDVKSSIVADQLKRTGDAARSYIKDNYAAITSTATAASPYQITAAMLTAGGYLPTSSVSSNGYGQNVCTLVLQPSANKLQAMVVTEGGTTIDDLTLGDIVQLAGSSSGAILSSASTTITGAMGGWSIPVATWHNKVNNLGMKCDGTTAGNVQVATGHPALALWFEDGSYQSNALYRDAVAGHPELNTVNTPIIFNTTQTVGAACTTSGALANDAAGVVINCTGGTWKQLSSAYWADPVASYAALPTCNAAAAWATRVVKAPSASGGTGPRAYTCNGTSWSALAVDDNGNLSLPGIMTAGKVQLNDVVVAGAGCPTNGQIAKDSTGLILSCQSGAWVALGAASCPGWSGDLNWLEGTAGQPGCINGVGLGNAPTSDYFFVEYNRHVNPANYYVSQRAVGMTGAAAGKTWTRSQQSGTAGTGWTAWSQILQVPATAQTAGGGCIANSVAFDATGLLLACQSGVWNGSAQPVHGGGWMYRYTDGACVSPNPQTGGCSCPSGTSAYNVSTAVNVPWWGPTAGYVCN